MEGRRKGERDKVMEEWRERESRDGWMDRGREGWRKRGGGGGGNIKERREGGREEWKERMIVRRTEG